MRGPESATTWDEKDRMAEATTLLKGRADMPSLREPDLVGPAAILTCERS